jgi:hypothetical protein
MEDPGEVVLVARLGGEVRVVHRAEVPTEKRPMAVLEGRENRLEFVDSGGGLRWYDLASVYDEGVRSLTLSVRVHAGWGVQVDALMTDVADEGRAWELFRNLRVDGLRFQPFFLPEGKAAVVQEEGRGLFYRGLHFAGWRHRAM